MTWNEFKLIVTDPPRYSGHFRLIKDEIIPFVNEHSFSFWITNYYSNTSDFILFRIKSEQEDLRNVETFLDDLKSRNIIADWQCSGAWDPRSDARTRIEGLRQKVKGYNPETHTIVGFDNSIVALSPDDGVAEKEAQLGALFEALGECTRAIYDNLDAKPNDLWIVSVFIHLLLNSIDYSGPGASSEEDAIRRIPPL